MIRELFRIILGGLAGGVAGALIAVPFIAVMSVLVPPNHPEPGMVIGLVGMVTAMVGFAGWALAGMLIGGLLPIAARRKFDSWLVALGTVVVSSPGAVAIVVFYASNFDAAMGWVAAGLAFVWITAAIYIAGQSASRLTSPSASESRTENTSPRPFLP